MSPPYRNLLRHLLRPARGGAAILIIVFAIILSIASKSLVGLPAVLIITSWFFKYAYVLFDHISRGYDDPPVLDISMVNPFSEQRPLAQLGILIVLGSIIARTYIYIGAIMAWLLVIIVLFFLPASVAILGLESNPFQALYPVAWARMMHGLGPLYGVILGLIAAEIIVVLLLRQVGLWPPLVTMLDMFCVLSVFSVLGGALYERRHEMGLDTWISPEQDAEKERKSELRENEKVVHEAYGLMRANKHVQSWELMQSWITSRGNEPHDIGWLVERVANWDDPRYATRFSEEHIARLCELKKHSDALAVLKQCLDTDPKFRPKSPADTLSLAQLAARGGGAPKIARTLLSDFSSRFPNDPRVGIAASLAQHLA